VQRCKSAYGLCKGGKGEAEEDYGVQITEDGVKACTSGRDAVAPLPDAARAARGAAPTR